MLEKLIFSPSGVFRLQQLAKQVHHITGIRHKLSDPDEVIGMLRECHRSRDQVIQSYYSAFTEELDSEQKSSLIRYGAYKATTTH